MQVTILLIVAAVVFLAGLAVGIGVQEAGTRQRERRIAEQRRDLAERARSLQASSRPSEWDDAA